MDDPIFLDKSHKLWRLLNQTRDMVSRVQEKELAQLGITGPKAAVLGTIQVIGKRATPSEISRRMFKRPNGISAMLIRMEQQGLVKRTNSLERHNLVRIVITKKGQQIYHKLTRRESLQRIMSSLSEEEQQQLESLLRKLRDSALNEP